MNLGRQESQERSLKSFEQHMKNCPCSFNLGTVDISDIVHTCQQSGIHLPILRNNTYEFLADDLEDKYDYKEFEDPIWKKNLLTKVYFELGKIGKAIRINKEILELETYNITALANSAFLFFLNEQVDDSFHVINQLQTFENLDRYKRMKLDGIIEQAYAYQKLGGGKNLLSCIQLLTVVSSQIHFDEKHQFLGAVVYRRICMTKVSWQFEEYPQTEHYATEAAKRLHSLGTTASDPTIRAVAIVELAYLRYQDRFKGTRQVSTQVWRDLLGDMSWRQLCFKALEITSSSDMVLKMIGSILKSHPKYREKAIECLKEAIKIHPSSRAYHHLGIAYIHKAIQYESENKTTRFHHKHFPPETLNHAEKRLRMILKLAKENIFPLSSDNEYAILAEENLRTAVEVSHKLNTKAQYDLAFLLVKIQNYAKARQTCKELITFFDNDDPEMVQQFSLVTVYDLYGNICALDAERATTDLARKMLLDQSEELLMDAVRMATRIAVTLPEFKNCATNLWKSFNRLTDRYTCSFEASNESKNKLIQLCDMVKDYRYLPKLDEMMTFLETNDCHKESIEIYVKNMLENNKYDDATLLLDFAKIPPSVKCELTWQSSEVIKSVMIHQAKRSLKISPNIVDPIWLNIMKEEFASTSLNVENLKDSNSLNIIIIEDIGDDYVPVRGSWSDKVSRVLKEIIQFNFGISVLRCHEIGQPGQQVLEVLQKAMSTSTVVMFVIDNELNLSSTSRDSQIQDDAPSVSPCCTTSTQDVYSEWFKFVIEAAVNSNTRDSKPAYILTVTNTNQTPELPSLLVDKPKLAVSKLEVDCLSRASNIKMDEKIEIIMRIFCKIVRTNYVSPKVSVPSGAVSIEAASVSHRLLHGAEA
ncbi:uncharacterized protein LOC131934841 [Physella acuta]|uniref:uncharacterized protein LOC131934841 n=1 Tax=Physella acuta TaxID=109671 RepID=UPI0027DAE1B2|nr:uncharacterized protein LOC131934841 [Physella acuta]